MKPTYKPDFSSILDVIDANPYLNMLFQEFSEEKSLLSELLFVHRNQLFPTLDERIQFQYIFWDNLEGSSSPETSVIAVEEKMARAKQFPKDMEMSLEDLVYNIRDLVLYFAVRFFRENEELMELANSESFDFTKMKETLKDFSSIRSTFEQIIQEILNVESCEEEIKKKLEYLGSLQWLTKNLLTDFMSMATNTLQQIAFLPMAGYEIKKRILHCQKLKPEEYTAIVNEMYMFKLFDRCQSIFWCENCRDVRQIYSSISMIDPYHVDMHCLKCQRPMCTAIVYHPIDELLKCISFKDGILAIYLGHLLREKHITFRYSVHTKFENDFVCTTDSGTVLIECGMHRTDVEQRGLKNILEKDVDQLIRHAETLKKEGNDVVLSVALSNYKSQNIENVVAQMNKSAKYGKPIREHNIRIVGYDQIISVLDEMKGS